MSRRVPSLGRRPARLAPKKRFLVYCEGASTEPSYFSAVVQRYPNALVKVEIVGPVGVAYTVAESAANAKKALKSAENSFEEGDEVWAVFDRDNHHRFDEALALCKANGVGIGLSNPCFELWLILHIEDYEKMDDHRAIQARLKRLRSDYNPKKRKCPNCSDLLDGLEAAERRAQKLLDRRNEERIQYGRPSTSVGHLTRAIRESSTRIR